MHVLSKRTSAEPERFVCGYHADACFFPWAGALDTLSRSEVETSQAMQHNRVPFPRNMCCEQADGLGEDAKVYLVYGEDTQPFLSMR